MSAKRRDMSAHEPGWAEVILGATLSVALGVVLGVVVLAVKPLLGVREMPKEPAAGYIYFVQGSRDTSKARAAAAKRKMFAQGGSVLVSEDEVNSFLQPLPPPATAPSAKKDAKKAPEKKAPAPAAVPPPKPGEPKNAPIAPNGEMLAIGEPNFHFHDGKVQIVVPTIVSVLGLDQPITVLADGKFVKKGDTFAFDPETLYLGSCPMQRVPFAAGLVAKKFISGQAVPEDVAAAWPKLADVSVEGSTLKLTMP